MGGNDPVSQAYNEVAKVVAPVTQAVADFVKPVTAPIEAASKELSRGDVGKYIGQTGTTLQQTGSSFVRGTGQLFTGNFSGAAASYGQTAGNVGNVLTYGGQNFIGRDKLAQDVLRSKAVDSATLGFSSDYAGFTRGGSTLAEGQGISNEDLNSAARFVAKGAAVGYAYKGYQALSTANKVVATSAAAAAAKGDAKGVVNAIAPGAGDTFNSYLPQLPSAPSWLPIPDLTSVYDSFINPAKNGAPGSGSGTPFNQSGATSGDAPPLASSPEAKSLIVLAAAAAAIFVIKKGLLK